ncbi:hypothetical protein [Pseudomonas sp. PS02302]|nr:hypothetical protein [Pseudomonas sp. PS02302]
MSQTAFGITLLSVLLIVCVGTPVWLDWSNIKQKALKLIRSH